MDATEMSGARPDCFSSSTVPSCHHVQEAHQAEEDVEEEDHEVDFTWPIPDHHSIEHPVVPPTDRREQTHQGQVDAAKEFKDQIRILHLIRLSGR